MAESTKINFRHRRVDQLSDYTELIEMLVPGNRNQQYAAACIFFELKWSHNIVPNLAHLTHKYNISHRILERTRAKLSHLGLIEHISRLNTRFEGRSGWKLSTRFERGLKQLSQKCSSFRDVRLATQNKDEALLEFTNSRRIGPMHNNMAIAKKEGGEKRL